MLPNLFVSVGRDTPQHCSVLSSAHEGFLQIFSASSASTKGETQRSAALCKVGPACLHSPGSPVCAKAAHLGQNRLLQRATAKSASPLGPDFGCFAYFFR